MTPETQPDCDARGRGVLVTVVVVVVVVSINFYWLWGAVWCGWCRTGRERGNSQDSWSCRAGISTERSNKLRPCMKQQPFSFDARPASSSMRVHAARAKYGSDCSSGLGLLGAATSSGHPRPVGSGQLHAAFAAINFAIGTQVSERERSGSPPSRGRGEWGGAGRPVAVGSASALIGGAFQRYYFLPADSRPPR